MVLPAWRWERSCRWSCPSPNCPCPPGPEPIGTVTVELEDSEREEVYGPSPGPGRRLMAQVWYPALDQGEVEPVLWSEDWDIVAPGVSTLMGFPGWFLSHTKYSSSHGGSSIPVAPGTFPVVIYSHGWTGFRTNSVHQIESLVSNGFIVVAIDHTYGAVATRFPDDEVVDYDPAAIPDPAEVGEEAYGGHRGVGRCLLTGHRDRRQFAWRQDRTGPSAPLPRAPTSPGSASTGMRPEVAPPCNSAWRTSGAMQCSASILGWSRFQIGFWPSPRLGPPCT